MGPGHYWNVHPSAKSLERERVKLKDMTSGRHSYWPIPMLIRQLNQHLRGWANYFRFGYPSAAFRQINHYVQVRLWQHLKRRSQRPYRIPQGVSAYQHYQQLGWRPLRSDGRATACEAQGDSSGESRMREIRTSGLTREEAPEVHGMRLVRHIRGNPETEYVEA